jgi:hypothetical protein
MKFITYNESPGGVYKSQVTDVCRFLQTTFNIPIELIAFVSLRTYFNDRTRIKKAYPNSTVLPAFPGIENWKKNQGILNLFMFFRKPDKAISRGVFATLLALDCKKITSVCFDARTAYNAEWKEYLAAESPTITSAMKGLEKAALFNSNFRIAVSNQLVSWWQENYGYDKNNHAVIPCTLESSLEQSFQNSVTASSEELRQKIGINESDVLLIFSGSSAAWQSLEGLYQLLKPAFNDNPSLKLLLLSDSVTESEFSKAFPDRVILKSVTPEKVADYLKAADYGLLYREESVTNKISSPVKFAEYLAAGLPVIISENVGDYSRFVKENNCGLLVNSIQWNNLKRPSQEERKRIWQIAIAHLTKSVYEQQYRKVIS